MNYRKFFLTGLIVCVIVLFGSFALPQSPGDTPALIGGICLILIPVFLIGFIISAIRAKRKPGIDPALTAALSAQSKATSMPEQTTAQASSPTSAPSPAMVTTTPAAPAHKKAVATEHVHVRGVDNYKENIKAVAWENPDYSLTKRELEEQYPDERVWQYNFDVKATLLLEPDNPVDPNAIMVQANGRCIGYVPKGSTTHIRKLMESERIQSMSLNIGGGKYKEVYENDDGKYELDRGEKPYSAVLELHLSEEQNLKEVTP